MQLALWQLPFHDVMGDIMYMAGKAMPWCADSSPQEVEGQRFPGSDNVTYVSQQLLLAYGYQWYAWSRTLTTREVEQHSIWH